MIAEAAGRAMRAVRSILLLVEAVTFYIAGCQRHLGHGHLGKAVRDLPQKLLYLTFRYDVCRQGILIPETTQVLMVRVLSSNPVSMEAGVDTMNTMPALICLLTPRYPQYPKYPALSAFSELTCDV
jgi:hypothetical protein